MLLQRGETVRGFVLPGDPLRGRIEKPGVEIVEGVLTDRSTLLPAVEGIDAVFHLGALLPQGRTADELFETNVRGTFNLLEGQFAHASRIQRFVFASTDNVYPDDQGLRYLPVDENHPWLNNDPYGLSKILGEDMCWSYMRRCGLRVAIPRFGSDLSWARIARPKWHPCPFLCAQTDVGTS